MEGADGFWDTGTVDDGRYLVTVEAWDFDGNLAQQTVPVTVNNHGGAATGTGPSWGQVFVKDSDRDFGQIPSVLGGEPFWASPDIIVVPKDTPVTPDTAAASFPLVVDQEYDARGERPVCARRDRRSLANANVAHAWRLPAGN